MNKKIPLAIGITVLFLGVVVTPMTLGYDVETSEEQPDTERYLYPEYYDCYSIDEIDGYVEYQDIEVSNDYKPVESNKPLDASPPMDSPWPMYCHDVRHTGRSPYSTVNTWDEIWRFRQHKNDYIRSSPVVGDDGTIYFGGLCNFFALYPNGTMKWKYDGLEFYVWSAPAIDENGTIYVGDCDGFFYAINPDGTKKWIRKFSHNIMSSPAIGDDGTLYFGDSDYYINALYSNNGSVKWRFKTGLVVYSSPAIGEDGTVYCGSHDEYLYALYPNNGTLKWKYKTGHWIRTSPCIADDGTIYVVSLDDHLHAVNPNGTLKWKTNMGEGGTSPTIGQDGTIYCGYTQLYAINPSNGSVKWKYDNSGKIKGSTPCHSSEDIIYFGAGTVLFAVNPDGTLKWKEKIANEYIDSAPAIGEDGRIYVGSACSEVIGGSIYSVGYLHAFGWCELEADANGPYYGQINESIKFQGSAKGGYRPHSYHWDFGDGNDSDEEDPIHIYSELGNYTVVFTVTDNTSNTSSDTSWVLIQETNNYPDKPVIEGPLSCPVKVEVCYTFHSTDPDGDDVKFLIDWGDDTTNETEYFPSSSLVEVCHAWEEMDKYTCRVKAVDIWGAESDWKPFEVKVTNPRTRATTYLWYQWFLDRHPILERLLSLIGVI